MSFSSGTQKIKQSIDLFHGLSNKLTEEIITHLTPYIFENDYYLYDYLPDLVTIISVPSLSNSSHKDFDSITILILANFG